MKQALDYIEQNKDRYIEELSDFLKIPSISTDPTYAPACQQASEWVADNFRKMGLTPQIIPTQRHPLVYAEWMGAGINAKTVLIYGHYDVQPASLHDGWETPPFEPVIKEGFIYARGATDDKGQFFTHLKAVEALLRTDGKLPVNVKFIIEGEEESGGESLAKFVRERGELLRADVCVISDTSMSDILAPVIVYGVRGIVGFEVVATGGNTDLHSGMYGGTVHNPIQALAELLAGLHDASGRVTVEGFYDDVLPLDSKEREALKQGAYTFSTWQAETGAPQAWGESEFTLSERIGARPTLEINGFAGGYYDKGLKAVIPSKALAKLTCRIVANQDPKAIFEKVKSHLLTHTPATITLEVTYLNSAFPASINIDNPMMACAVRAYEQGWGATPIFKREGGSLPIVADLKNHLQMPVIMMGFGLNSDGLHGPNEHFSLEMFQRGIITSVHFLQQVSQL